MSGPRLLGRFLQGEHCQIDPTVTLYNVELGKGVVIFPGAVIGRPPLSSGATQRRLPPRDPLPVVIGEGCVIGANAVIYDDVVIGPYTMVCDTACIREGVRIGAFSLVAMGVTINYDTILGDRVRIMDNSHITGNAVVENDVFIGMLVTTANDNAMIRHAGLGDWKTKGPTIKRFARIGQGACLLPGVVIGENAIVGANAVVTGNVEAETLVMGVPARFHRRLRDEEIVKG